MEILYVIKTGMTFALSCKRPCAPFNAAATDTTPVQPVARLPALLLIDIQKEFCDPTKSRGNDETVVVSHRILSASFEFRAIGLPFYPIYFTRSREEPLKKIDYYGFVPKAKDTVIQKNTDSAFDSSDIDSILKRDGHTDLLVCGFNLNACVRDTVLDAANNGFKVTLIRDLTGNDKWNDPAYARRNLDRMTDAGVTIITSRDALTRYRTIAPSITT
jgi:nicotinamidase-related amidase